jgi:hypothetical protein
MCDDLHGTEEWDVFVASMKRVFPDRPIVEIQTPDQIFHTIYDLDDRYQMPGAQYLRSGNTYEYDGFELHWRGIYDHKGRLMVAIGFDMDLGDSWQWADEPRYDERFSALGIRARHPHRRKLRCLRHDPLSPPAAEIGVRWRKSGKG